MESCYKNHYTVEPKGIELKEKSDKYKKAVFKRVSRSAKALMLKKPNYYMQFKSDYTFFIKGNDAVIEYIPKITDKKDKEEPKKKIIKYANSSVSYHWNVFHNDYILVSPSPKYTYLHTNRKKEINNGTYRDEDTEAKLLEFISLHINENEQGTINLYTRLEPCLSCDNVIIQFMNQYKYITINVYFEELYLPKNKGGK